MACLVQEDGIADGFSSATALLSSSWMSDREGAPAAAEAPPLAHLSNQELLSELLARCQEYDGAAWAVRGNVSAAELVEGAKTASRLCNGGGGWESMHKALARGYMAPVRPLCPTSSAQSAYLVAHRRARAPQRRPAWPGRRHQRPARVQMCARGCIASRLSSDTRSQPEAPPSPSLTRRAPGAPPSLRAASMASAGR